MNWQTQLNNSFIWILTALLSVTVELVITALLLKRTQFGKKFWLISKPCFENSNKYKTLGLILLLLLFILLEVRISVLNTFFFITGCTAHCKIKTPMRFGFSQPLMQCW